MEFSTNANVLYKKKLFFMFKKFSRKTNLNLYNKLKSQFCYFPIRVLHLDSVSSLKQPILSQMFRKTDYILGAWSVAMGLKTPDLKD